MLEQNIQWLIKQDINLEDAIDIREIKYKASESTVENET